MLNGVVLDGETSAFGVGERILVLPLPDGDTEYLVTNLDSLDVPGKELEVLYHMRWGVETKYDELKNRLAFENFNGKDDNAIKQDFYASLLVMNL